MSLIYFDLENSEALFSAIEEGITKNAIVLVEGEHISNDGKKHYFSPNRIRQIARNSNVTNSIIPIKVEHGQKPIRTNFATYEPDEELGELTSSLICRRISASDVNEKNKALVGKLAIFAKAKLVKGIEDVKSKALSCLSAGLDTVKNAIEEVSVVVNPSIQGMALFSADSPFTYTAAKEKAQENEKLKEQLQKCFDIFFGVIVEINSIDEEKNYNLDPNILKLNALEDFQKDIKNNLNIEDPESLAPKDKLYNSNPYSETIIGRSGNAGFNRGGDSSPRKRSRKTMSELN